MVDVSQLNPITKVIRAGVNAESQFHDVVSPLHLTTTFVMPELGAVPNNDYSRANNPTRSLLARAIADLEGGYDAIITASGMGAVQTLLEAFVPTGAAVVAPVDCYGGTWRLLDAQARKGRLQLQLADFTDLEALAKVITADVALVFVESPSNPLLRITDIAAVAELTHAAGAILVADNTFASPIWQRPLELGVDIVIHSATKYLAGHSDVVLGAIVSKESALHEEVKWWSNCIGVTAGAIDCYFGLRGLRTLQIRVATATKNATNIATMLATHRATKAVYYPGLPTHPGHEIAARQQSGFGAIVSFELADEDAVRAFLAELKLFSLAESLGGVESLVSHSATMTHAAMTPQAQAEAGITPGLLRLSVGIEPCEDLLADLRNALEAVR